MRHLQLPHGSPSHFTTSQNIPFVAEMAIQEVADILDIIDTSSQLPLLSKVVDSHKQCLSPAGTIRVLETISTWCACAK
jgi:hypothetical protein